MKEIGVYIAGPLYSSGDLVTNNRRAIDAAQELEQAQVEGVVFRPFIPHVFALTWQLVHQREHQLAQDWDDFWLRKCDYMIRLPGYSVGSEHEERVAFVLNIPVFHTAAALIAAMRYGRAIAAYRLAERQAADAAHLAAFDKRKPI